MFRAAAAGQRVVAARAVDAVVAARCRVIVLASALPVPLSAGAGQGQVLDIGRRACS